MKDFIELMAAERAELVRQRAAVNQDDDRYRYVGGILLNRFGNVVNWKRYFTIVDEWKRSDMLSGFLAPIPFLALSSVAYRDGRSKICPSVGLHRATDEHLMMG